MKDKINIAGGAIVEKAPVVRISGAGQVRSFKIKANAFDRGRMHIVDALRATRSVARFKSPADPAYIGCLWRDDNSLALIAVDRVDNSVKLHWEPEELFRNLADDPLVDDESISKEATPKTSPRVVSLPNREAIPKRDAFVRVNDDQASQAGAELIRRMRAARGMSRSQLAERLGVAVSRVAELESGRGPQGPTLGLLARVAEACEIDLNVSLQLKEA
jgi:DNA-binding transcriptional regulator YiaG